MLFRSGSGVQLTVSDGTNIYSCSTGYGFLYANTWAHLEFVRYGNTWDRLQRNIAVLKEHQVTYSFAATISNLTLIGIPAFVDWANDVTIAYSPCTDPEFLSIYVLDNESKEVILNSSDKFPTPVQDMITTAMLTIPSLKQRLNFKNYLTTFAQRRSLDLAVFPQSLINWAME